MRCHTLTLALGLLLGCSCFAQDSASPMDHATQGAQASSPGATQESGQPTSTQARNPGTAIAVELNRALDAKKLKEGEPVRAKVTSTSHLSDGTMITPGAMVEGHIRQATARANGAEQSSLAIVFDNVVLKNGQQVAIKASIQAVAAPPIISNSDMYPPAANIGAQPPMNSPGSPAGGTGPVGGSMPTGGLPQAPPYPRQAPTGQGDSGLQGLTPQSTGVLRMPGIELQADSLLTSRGKDLKLDAGSQMILRVQNQ